MVLMIKELVGSKDSQRICRMRGSEGFGEGDSGEGRMCFNFTSDVLKQTLFSLRKDMIDYGIKLHHCAMVSQT